MFLALSNVKIKTSIVNYSYKTAQNMITRLKYVIDTIIKKLDNIIDVKNYTKICHKVVIIFDVIITILEHVINVTINILEDIKKIF